MREILGSLIGSRYLITNHLGGGGFGQTYLAQDTHLPNQRRCVVKHLMPVVREGSEFIPAHRESEHFRKAQELFVKEAKILNKLGDSENNHGFVPKLFAYFEEDRDFFLVQELIEGQDLSKELSGKKLTESEVVSLLKDILTPLCFIHQKNAIHRDLKPKNLMRRQKDRKIVLIDFGAVKEVISRTNSASGQSITISIGSLGYMPHEQSLGRPTLSSDIYAVGMTALEALTGLHPHNIVQSVSDRATNKLNWRELVEVSPEFGAILDKMICEDYHQRYQSALQVLKKLKDYEYSQLGSTFQINNTSTRANDEKKDNKHLLEITIAVLGVIAAAIPVVQAFISSSDPPKPPDPPDPPSIRKVDTDIPLNGKLVESKLNKEQICSDLMVGRNYSCQKYTFKGQSGQKASIEMNSNDFDPFLILQDSEGKKLATNGDISSKNLNSKIVVDLTEDGNYTIVARTTAEGESGEFSIRAIVK